MIVDKPTLLFVTAVIVFFGGVGGVINALLTENGFVLPKCSGSQLLVRLREVFTLSLASGAPTAVGRVAAAAAGRGSPGAAT
jgi:hypothetical protein